MFPQSVKWPEREADVISVYAGLKMNVILSLPLPIRLYTNDNAYEIITDVFGSNHGRAIDNRDEFSVVFRTLQTNAGIALQIRKLPHYLTSFPICCSLIILSFNVMQFTISY